MKIHCISIFPEIIQSALAHSIPGKAQERGLLELNCVQLRDFATDKHQKVDDIPYGGGVGMVFKCEPVVRALRHVASEESIVIHPTPAAPRFTHQVAADLAHASHLVFIASRYEGLDQRVIDRFVDRAYSLGDYVLSGGELAVAVMIDVILRFVPGNIRAESYREDSFFNGILDHPHYTRPPDFEGLDVPEVLQHGNHEAIRLWRKTQALKRTLALRPDLLQSLALDAEAEAIIDRLRSESESTTPDAIDR